MARNRTKERGFCVLNAITPSLKLRKGERMRKRQTRNPLPAMGRGYSWEDICCPLSHCDTWEGERMRELELHLELEARNQLRSLRNFHQAEVREQWTPSTETNKSETQNSKVKATHWGQREEEERQRGREGGREQTLEKMKLTLTELWTFSLVMD